MNKLIPVLFLFVFFFGQAYPVFAAGDDASDIEGFGLLNGKVDGALGDGAWDDSTRKDVTMLFEAMPPVSSSFVSQRLIRSALLGKSDFSVLKGSRDAETEKDLLSLRLHKLVEAGNYTSALEMFSAIPEEREITPLVLEEGILAMLGSGEKSVACLEIKTRDIPKEGSDFWSAIEAYCDVVFSENKHDAAIKAIDSSPYGILQAMSASPDYHFTYDAAKFHKFTSLERALLIAEQKINVDGITKNSISRIPASHLTALLAQDTLSAEQRIMLSVRAYRFGFTDLSTLKALYKGYEGTDLPLPLLYQKMTDEDDVQALGDLLHQAMKLYPEYSYESFLPFVGFFKQTELTDFSGKEMKLIASIYYRLDQAIPIEILEGFLSKYDDQEEIHENIDVIAAILLMDPAAQRQYLSTILPKINTPAYSSHFFVVNVIENLDKSTDSADNAAKVYEKDFVLPLEDIHHISAKPLRSRLYSLSQNKILGETVLLSIYVLDKLPLSGLYPGLFEELETNFDKVGLTEISRDLAIEGLLGMKQ